MGLHTDQLKGFREKAPDWFEHLWSDKPEMYLNLMESVIYEAARRGKGVIIGHGSQMLLHDFGCAMHVLVTAHEESRIHRLMHRNEALTGSCPEIDPQERQPEKGVFPVRLPQRLGRPNAL